MDTKAASDSKLDLAAAAARWEALTVPYLIERAGLDLDKTAVVHPDGTRAYGELRERSRRVGNALVGLGVEEMDRVALLSSNRLEYFEIELGIASAPAIMVPLNWRLQGRELEGLLRRSKARVAFVEDRLLGAIDELRDADRLPDLKTVIGVPAGGDVGYEELCEASSADRPARRGTLSDPHEIIYTSGTTGDPKGVVWTNGGLMFSSIEQVMDFNLTPACSTYVMIDLHYIGGRHDFTWALLHRGATVHVRPSGGFDAAEVVRYVSEHRITHVLWVPTMLYEILRVPGLSDYDMSALRTIMCGGAPISISTIERAEQEFPRADFIQVYGLTEGGGSVTCVPPQDAKRKAGSAGKASMHNQIRIVDGRGSDQPAGEDGEILVKGPTVTLGYWDAPEQTSQTIVDGWLHTGDVGHLDEEDFLYVTGRKKDMIISGGMNIFPAEIENVLREHPDVLDAAVIGLPDEKWGERLFAVVEALPAGEVSEEEVITFCRDRLASYKKPSEVRVIDELPRTMSGKPQKFKLRERFGGDLASSEARSDA